MSRSLYAHCLHKNFVFDHLRLVRYVGFQYFTKIACFYGILIFKFFFR